VWSPDAGIQVRLKVEDYTDPTHSVETEATVTTAGAWETLIFNFSNEAPGTAELNLDYYLNKASIFFNFGVEGAAVGEKTYYFDDVEFYPGGGTAIYNVTFAVNMNEVTEPFTTPEVNGTFNGWCGGCNPLADADGDGIWTATIPLASGFYEYKYAADGWAIQESLTPGDPCTMTTDIFTNRTLYLESDVVLDPVCWGSCDNCPAPACTPVAPTGIYVDAITASSAVVNWDPVIGADQYVGVLWNLSTGVIRKFRPSSESSAYALTAALTPSTTYGVRLKTTCLDEGVFSPYSAWYYFTTAPLRLGKSNTELSVYPNPTSGIIAIEGVNFSGETRVNVTDVTGQTVYQNTLTNNSQVIDLSYLANGLYFMSISNGVKREVINLSIVK
ncbi:MAG: T9SS type A sorting domain-containing protein, partial [Chitinophagales bacterium]